MQIHNEMSLHAFFHKLLYKNSINMFQFNG